MTWQVACHTIILREREASSAGERRRRIHRPHVGPIAKRHGSLRGDDGLAAFRTEPTLGRSRNRHWPSNSDDGSIYRSRTVIGRLSVRDEAATTAREASGLTGDDGFIDPLGPIAKRHRPSSGDDGFVEPRPDRSEPHNHTTVKAGRGERQCCASRCAPRRWTPCHRPTDKAPHPRARRGRAEAR